MVKWVTKKGIQKIQEEHQQDISGRDNQIKALKFTNEAHQQKTLRLSKEIDDLIANRHAARRGCFDNILCFIKKNSGEGHPYYVIRCQYRQLKNISNGLNLVTQTWEATDKCDDPNAIHKWNDQEVKCEVIKKPNYYKNHFSLTNEKRELLETALDVTI